MSRLFTLWLLDIVGHDVGRYISVERLIDSSRATYYEALRLSTEGAMFESFVAMELPRQADWAAEPVSAPRGRS